MPATRPPSKKAAKKPVGKASPGKSRPPRKSGGKGPWRDWRLHLLLLATTVLLVGLIWLARREEQSHPTPEMRPANRSVETRNDRSTTAREQIEAFLAATAVPATAIFREPAEAPVQYQVRNRPPSAKAVAGLRQRLRQLTPPLVLSTPEDGVLTIADSQGKILITVQYLPAPAPSAAVPPAPGKGGRVTIIVDDLGRSLKQAKQLLAISQPVTFAILAIEPHAAEVARMAHAAGREVMLHVPMEPQGFPVVDPGDDALLVSQPDEVLRRELKTLLERVPHASGVNNHMGSRFTENERAMTAVMAELHDHGLFFVDSLTSGQSVGASTARQAGVPVIKRDVFLDNVAEVEPITREIRRLAEKARRNGGAVGICHPYPETLQALRQELPKLAAQGVEFVTVAELLGGGEGGGR